MNYSMINKNINDFLEKMKFEEATLKEYPNIFVGKCNEENILPSYNRVVIPKNNVNNAQEFILKEEYFSDRSFCELLVLCDKFSIGILDKCLSIAMNGILERPILHKNKNDINGYPVGKYHYLAHPDSIKIPGINEFKYLSDQCNSTLSAECFLRYKGVEVYLCESIPIIKDQEGRYIAWNLFLGDGDYVHFKKIANIISVNLDENFTVEMDAMKPLKFPSRDNPNQLIEQGIINSFVACE